MKLLQEIYEAIAMEGFSAKTLSLISKYINYYMGQQAFLDSIYQSMEDSARLVRFSLGRPSSRTTREKALRQVAMLQAAKEAAQQICK